MHPVTGQLLAHISDRHIIRFVEAWDALELLVIRVYRTREALRSDERLYRRLRRELPVLRGPFAADLAAYWSASTIAGEPVTQDPFEVVLRVEQAATFMEDWAIMQNLPVARQTINEWLVDMINPPAA